MLTDTSGLGDIYIKDDESSYVNMLIDYHSMLYIFLCHIDHDFVGSTILLLYLEFDMDSLLLFRHTSGDIFGL